MSNAFRRLASWRLIAFFNGGADETSGNDTLGIDYCELGATEPALGGDGKGTVIDWRRLQPSPTSILSNLSRRIDGGARARRFVLGPAGVAVNGSPSGPTQEGLCSLCRSLINRISARIGEPNQCD